MRNVQAAGGKGKRQASAFGLNEVRAQTGTAKVSRGVKERAVPFNHSIRAKTRAEKARFCPMPRTQKTPHDTETRPFFDGSSPKCSANSPLPPLLRRGRAV